MTYQDLIKKAFSAIYNNRFEDACNIADKLYKSIIEESSDRILLISGEQINNPAEFFLNIGLIYGIQEGKENLALSCYNKANLYSFILEKIKKNRIVYTFRDINIYSIADLVNHTLTVSSPSSMNDPSDSLLYDWECAREQNWFKNIYSSPDEQSQRILHTANDYPAQKYV